MKASDVPLQPHDNFFAASDKGGWGSVGGKNRTD